MNRIELPSGSILEVQLLSFEEAWNIFQLFSKTIEEMNMDIKDFSFFKQDDDKRNFTFVDFLKLKGPICSILSNKSLSEAGVRCLDRCIYNGLKIDRRTFDSQEARGDFLPSLFYALKENVSPFFGNLISYFAKK